MSGRDALHSLDDAVEVARGDFNVAVSAAEAHTSRRTDLVRLRADGYRQLAKMRLDVIKGEAAQQLSAAEQQAIKLLDDHAHFLETIGGDVQKAEAAVAEIQARRLAAEQVVDAALHAYEAQVAATEKRLETDASYHRLKQGFEDAKSVAARAAQKLEVAKGDRAAKGAPYEADPLFSYLWKRHFRTPDYRGGALTRMLDGWVAKTCGYDDAYMNYARLIELPDRLAEHMSRMQLEQAEAEAAIERYEAAALEADGAGTLNAALGKAREDMKAIDAEHAAAEARHADLRMQQEKAATGDSGPYQEACKLIEEGLGKASFPDLKVLASQTTTLDDDRIVDALIKLRTQELQMEVDWRNVEAQPTRRRGAVEALEMARQRFKSAGLDSPYVMVAGPAFQAALAAYGQGQGADGEALWRALMATVRQAPQPDDSYFGGPRRGRSISVPGVIAGVVLDEVIRSATRGGRWGGGGWGGGFGGGGGGFGGGGFSSGGGFGGGGFKTGGKF